VIGAQLKRLVRHSAIYGLGGIVSRVLAIFLLPLYTRYLGRVALGSVETLVAGAAVLVILLRAGISSAFFRFYFDTPDPERRIVVVRTSFWFTMTTATAGLAAGLVLAPQLSQAIFATGSEANLVRAAFVGIWAQMNYEQLTSLFRVEERSVAFVIASLVNIFITVTATVLLVVVYHKGPVGVIVGNFLGTLCVYLALLAYRRDQLGLQFDRTLIREMNRFGLAARAVRARALGDELQRPLLPGEAERSRRGRALLDRCPRRLRDRVVLDRVPHGMACVRVLDRGRQRGAAHLRLRAHVPARARVLARALRSACCHRGSSAC